MRHVVIIGGSIAAATAASTLRADGWDGDITVVGDEAHPPYSRVPLSKGVIAGLLPVTATELPSLPADVDLRTGHTAVALHTELRAVEFADGTRVRYDRLVIATGARARRLAAPDQSGELVVRTLQDAQSIAARVDSARTAVIVGGGFLGMEVASTLVRRGLRVTVIDRDPPLQRLLGRYLADVLVGAAVQAGLRVLVAPDGVELVGDPISGVLSREHGELSADLVVSAVGDTPNIDWLRSSGLPLAGGVVADRRGIVAPGIVAAGDVAALAHSSGVVRRTPHWTSAVSQGRTAARSLLDPTTAPGRPDPYFWTEQFGCDLKLVGELPFHGEPDVVDGNIADLSALLRWDRHGQPSAAASLNFRTPIVKLKALAAGPALPSGRR